MAVLTAPAPEIGDGGVGQRRRAAVELGDDGAFAVENGAQVARAGVAGPQNDGGRIALHAALAERVRMLRNYGQRVKYEHVFLAYNRRLDTLQAAVLGVKLPHLDGWNASRRLAAKRYASLLRDSVQTPAVADYAEPVYHLYVVRCPNRDAVAAQLKEAGIDTGLHYPVPIHLQEAYRYLGLQAGAFPEAERACHEVLTLPMFPYMTDEEIEAVAAAVKQAVAQG